MLHDPKLVTKKSTRIKHCQLEKRKPDPSTSSNYLGSVQFYHGCGNEKYRDRGGGGGGHPGPYMYPFPFANGVPERVQNDCVHWCLPGPIDTWNEILLEVVKRWQV